jgi:RES domain-containing protein
LIKSYRLAYTASLLAAFRPRGAEARWNSEGSILVYTSEHPALAALEILHGWEVYATLRGYHLYRCTFPLTGSETLVREAPEDLDIFNKTATRAYGDAWVQRQESAVLKVRSVVPESYNYLLNPSHPEFMAQVKLEHLGSFGFDERIEELVRRAKLDAATLRQDSTKGVP